MIQEYEAMYQHGMLTMDNPSLFERLDLTDCEFGVQIASDGRVWVCVNGVSFLRFKPTEPGLRSSAAPAPSHVVEGTTTATPDSTEGLVAAGDNSKETP